MDKPFFVAQDLAESVAVGNPLHGSEGAEITPAEQALPDGLAIRGSIDLEVWQAREPAKDQFEPPPRLPPVEHGRLGVGGVRLGDQEVESCVQSPHPSPLPPV